MFPIVRKVEAELAADHTLDKEYLPIVGDADFIRGARMALFGWDSPHVASDRIATIQTLSGTGALRVIADTFKKFRPVPIYISSPSWPNHEPIFSAVGLEVRKYRYYDENTKTLDIAGMLEDLETATPGSIVMWQLNAHNPCAVEPTEEQWIKIAEVCKRNKLYPFFDNAYQGLSTGDLDKDAFGLRYFLDQASSCAVLSPLRRSSASTVNARVPCTSSVRTKQQVKD